MGKRREQPEAEIARRLANALLAGSPNGITATELREWAVEYLTEYDEELSRFPESAGKPHWNLWVMDARFEDALFAALVFRSNGVWFFCGTGDAFVIKRFAESGFPDDVGQLPSEMARRFVIPESGLNLGREEAEAWLGRSW